MITIYFTLLGLMIGSFLNVVIYRLPEEKSIIFPPSSCGACNTRLKPLDLIPVLSYLFYRGRCRYCDSKISFQYPLIEIVTGLFFCLLYLTFGLQIGTFLFAILVSLLIAGSVIDLKYMIIPNEINYFGIVVGFLGSLIFDHISWTSSLLGIIIPSAFIWAIIVLSRGGMGYGDLKLVAMIGSFIGPLHSVISIFLGAFVGTIITLPLILKSKDNAKKRIPFGPLISLGALIMIFAGDKIVDSYLQFLIN